MTLNFYTTVLDMPPSPMGLLGRSFVVRHRCMLCSQTVETADLVEHARSHGQPPSPPEGGAID